MDIKIYPSKPSGTIKVPPSKSMAHRAIICASLANGTSTIKNIGYSQDILTTIDGMRKLGATIIEDNSTLHITGIKDFNSLNDSIIQCNESGSTLRFFIPIFSLTGKSIRFKGKNRLLKRPQEIYENIFKEHNLKYVQTDDYIEIMGKIKSGNYNIPGNISSQFISGLLFSLPLLEVNSTINIIPPFESKSYVDLTIDMLSKFGIKVYFKDENKIIILGNQKYSPSNYEVEGDFSQLGFFAVLGAINNTISCTGLNTNSKQGDKEIIDILKTTNIKIDTLENGYTFYPSIPKGLPINLENCPDLGPILMVLGMFSSGKMHIFNAKRLRYKESDRIEAMETELKKLGVDIISDEDNIFINGRKEPTEYNLYSHLDHRIVMSLAVAATKLSKPIIIKDAHVIDKSYPNFFDDLKKLGIHIEIINNNH